VAAIKPGVDLSNVVWKFLAWLLTDTTEGVARFATSDDARALVADVATAIAPATKPDKPVDFVVLTGRGWHARREAILREDIGAHFATGMAYAAALAAHHAIMHSPDWPHRVAEIAREVGAAAPDNIGAPMRQAHFEAQAKKLAELIEAI
jgi:hypothetical protein